LKKEASGSLSKRMRKLSVKETVEEMEEIGVEHAHLNKTTLEVNKNDPRDI